MGGAMDDRIDDTATSARPLDLATREALSDHVEAAKARGWTQDDLRAFFERLGVGLSEYLAARRGEAVRRDVAAAVAQVSITALPERPIGAPEADDYAEIPAQMKAARRWLLWRSETDPDRPKPRKTPYYANGQRRHGALDSAEDVARLATFDEAIAALTPDHAGLGFALGPDEAGGCWQGIDLDELESHPGLRFVADDLPGYTERSPSGKGVHAIGYGREFRSLGSNSTGIEAYARGRFFTVTGEACGFGEIACLADFVERRLAPLHSPRPQDTSARVEEGAGSIAGALAVRDLRSALAHMRSDDRDLWIRMGHALKTLGDQGRGLWLEWSQTSAKYDAADAAATWDSFKPTHTGFQAVFAEAQRQGWINPAAGGQASVQPATREVIDPETGEVTEVPTGPAGAWNLKDWTAAAYTGPAPEITWLCDGTIPLGIPVLFASMGGLGKSYMAIDLGLKVAVEVATSVAPRPVLGGEVVQTGTAVILSAEDSRASIHRRLEQIDPEGRRHADPDRLIIVPLPDAGGPQPLIASDGRALSMTPAFHALRDELVKIPDLKLIVIDPLQAFVLADVNADPAAGQFMWSAFASLCAATGATLIVAHHMRKDGASSIKTADEAREAIRGSTALVDGARLTYALWKAGAEDGRDMCARLDVDYAPERIAFGAVVKANDQANRDVQTYVRQDSGLLVDQSARVAATNAPRGVSASLAQEIVQKIGEAWEAARQGRGEGYAMSPQSGERQAWKLVKRMAGCSEKEARELAAAWVANGILEMQTVDAKRHRSALRLVGRLG